MRLAEQVLLIDLLPGVRGELEWTADGRRRRSGRRVAGEGDKCAEHERKDSARADEQRPGNARAVPCSLVAALAGLAMLLTVPLAMSPSLCFLFLSPVYRRLCSLGSKSVDEDDAPVAA